MIDEKTNKSLKTLNYLSFIPYIGYLIVVFWGAFKVDGLKKGKSNVFAYMLLSMLCLVAFSLLVLPVIYFVVTGIDQIALKISLVLIMAYIAFTGAALCSNLILKNKLNKI